MDLRRLHEPPSKTGASAYSHLCTVIQAAPLAVLLSVIANEGIYTATVKAFEASDLNAYPWPELVKSFLSLLVISVVWHRYVLDNNFVAWKLTGIDTLIPFSFAMLQCLMALAVTKSAASFIFWIFSLNATGIVAYWQVIPRFKRPHARLLYQLHYGDEGEKIYCTMLKYFSESLRTLIWTAAASFLCFVLVASNVFGLVMSMFLVSVITIVIVFWLYIDDCHSRLDKWFMQGAESDLKTPSLPQPLPEERQPAPDRVG
jgi:hypothetical protein